jgi:hypothetical protein
MRDRRTDILNRQRKSTRGGVAAICDEGSRLARATISLGIVSPMGKEADSAVSLVQEALEPCRELKAVNF